ncbi:MAG: PcfJ domain-containing protein [Parachlamydiales bacterium]
MYDQLVKCQCPKCNAKLEITYLDKLESRERIYMAFLNIIKDFQVIRMVVVTKYFQKNHPTCYSLVEVMQHWIRQDGKVTTLAKNVQSMCYEYDRWCYTGDLAFRNTYGYKANLRYELNPLYIYNHGKILPIIKRNGFKGNFHEMPPHILFSQLLKDSVTETLFKADQYNLVYYRYKYPEDVDRYWPQIKICIRNGFTVDNYKDWMDYLKLLVEFGKDIHNPKYICPVNFDMAHNNLVKEKTELF